MEAHAALTQTPEVSFGRRNIITQIENVRNYCPPVKAETGTYYLVTNSMATYNNAHIGASTLSAMMYNNKASIYSNQINLMSMSSSYFKNSQPLSGIELAVLNKTYSKSFSKTPRKL